MIGSQRLINHNGSWVIQGRTLTHRLSACMWVIAARWLRSKLVYLATCKLDLWLALRLLITFLEIFTDKPSRSWSLPNQAANSRPTHATCGFELTTISTRLCVRKGISKIGAPFYSREIERLLISNTNGQLGREWGPFYGEIRRIIWFVAIKHIMSQRPVQRL